MVFCRGCGAQIHSTAPLCPRCGAPQAAVPGPGTQYGFGRSVAACLNAYATFAGRAARAEYWYFMLFYALVQVAAAVIDASAFNGVTITYPLANLALLLPVLSVTVRRLHDGDRSGWWYWIALVPAVGAILLFVWFVSRGTQGPNRYGPDPLGAP